MSAAVPSEPNDSTDAKPVGKRRWAARGLWGMMDMALFAGGNFLTHIVLARWLTEESYGKFTTAFTVYLLLAVVNTSVVIEPMMVYGSRRYRRRLPAYLGEMVRMHLRFACGYGVLLLAGAGLAAFFGDTGLAQVLAVFAVAQLPLLMPWILRDACYINTDPRPAGIAGMIYVGSVIAGLVALDALHILSAAAAVAVLGIAATIASAWLMTALRLWRPALRATRSWQTARQRHVRFGRWALLTNFIRFVPEHLPLILVPIVLGYAMGGALKAMINLITPFVLVTWALSNLSLPLLVRRVGRHDFETAAWRVALLAMAGPLLCWPLLGVFGEPIVGWLYDGKFVDEAWMMWLMGLLPVLISGNCILFAMFRALDRPALLLPGTTTAAVVLVLLGMPLMWATGLWGMVVGMLGAQVVLMAMLVRSYASRLRAMAIGSERKTAAEDFSNTNGLEKLASRPAPAMVEPAT
ncbi:MAG: hypothetical protein AAGF84_01710 [Planctomycetota bacterium]